MPGEWSQRIDDENRESHIPSDERMRHERDLRAKLWLQEMLCMRSGRNQEEWMTTDWIEKYAAKVGDFIFSNPDLHVHICSFETSVIPVIETLLEKSEQELMDILKDHPNLSQIEDRLHEIH